MQIIITVSDPEVRKEYGGAKQYYLYNLKGQDNKGNLYGNQVQLLACRPHCDTT